MQLTQGIVVVVVEYPRVVSRCITSRVFNSPNVGYLTADSFLLPAPRTATFANPESFLASCKKNYIPRNKITEYRAPLLFKSLNNRIKVLWPAFCKSYLVNKNEESVMSSQKQYNQMSDQPAISSHAQQRMDLRGMSERDIELVLKFGRRIHSRRTVFHVIGRKEIKKYASECPELKELDGLHVLTVPDKGTVLTAYRNHDLRHIRPSKRKHKHLH